MNHSLKKLEYDKVLRLLAAEAAGETAKAKILELVPSATIDEAREELALTDEAFTLSSRFGTPRFSGAKDVRLSLSRAQSGSSLPLRDLLDIAAALRLVAALDGWADQCGSLLYKLKPYFNALITNKPLESEITSAILSEDELSDNASPQLLQIRRAILREASKIRETLDRFVRSGSKFLQEAVVTQRDGRYVIPVKTEHKSEVGGIIHDTSGSGATVFIEPTSVVESNNEIRILKGKEQDEIERIIAELSAKVGEFAHTLIIGFSAAVEIEVRFAKANLGAKMKATSPELTDTPLLDLRSARHPLLPRDTAVPVTIQLGINYDTLVITGPNTGGKTVALKTAGLLALMALSGLMLPVKDESKVGFFSGVFADIGDEQSIEQSLSTFSSHISNIVSILSSTSDSTLVLLDELGSGTDPAEGAALAVSIIGRLRSNGAKVMATTHYQEVKLFALETAGVENAGCEFDINTLRPTYRLLTGIPGKSNAFAIAGRLGIDKDIIAGAEKLVSGENIRFENIIEQLEKTRRELELARASATDKEREIKENSVKTERILKETEELKEKELAAARTKAAAIIAEVRFSADRMLEDTERLRKERKPDTSDKARDKFREIEKNLEKLSDQANPVSQRRTAPYKLPRPLKLYDTVLLFDIDKKGTLLSLADKNGVCLVQVGIMKTKTNVGNLRLLESDAKDRVKVNGRDSSLMGFTPNSDREVSLSLDLRGKTSDEALTELDRYLDSCALSGLKSVSVVHGKGTGALRTAVRAFLKRRVGIESFREGEYGEGDSGVTVVTLK
ncbi:MAG: endonuclease MutS2 [Oscillospiraceae bacterium]|jgi:DNA mismatch repair protein MutS2|nr:endonuclease MutS2 [Oscillospiraceae bacterium]